MNNKTKAAIGAAIVLLLAIGWWLFSGDGVDPAVASLEKQREFAFSDQATDADRQAFRDAVGQLTDDQRRQLFERGRPDMERRMAERMREIFALPPAELRQLVSDRADEIVARRNAPRNDGPPRGGPPGGRGPMTEAQRDSMRKQRLDNSDPGMRGQFGEFRRMVNEELESRGQDELSGRDMRGLMGGGRPPRG